MTGILMMSVGNSYGFRPVNTVAPVVTGTATVGQTLTTTNGTWTAAPAITGFTYQWQRGASNIGGATSSTYVLQTADIGNTVRCVVTATNPVGSTSANSNSTATVQDIFWVVTTDTNWSDAWSHATFANSSGVWPALCNGGYQGGPRAFVDSNGNVSSLGLYPGNDSSVYPSTPSTGSGNNSFTSWIGQPSQYWTNTSDGSYYLVGECFSGSARGCGMVKVNSSGTAVWYRRYSSFTSSPNSPPNQIWRDSSGFNWVSGRTEFSAQNGFILRLDDSGNLISNRSFNAGYGDTQGVISAVTDSSNNVVFAIPREGRVAPLWSWVTKMDSTMSSYVFRKRFRNAQVPDTNGRGVFITNLYPSGSTTYVSGWTNTEGSVNREALLMSLDSSGNLSWGWRVSADQGPEGGAVYVDGSGSVWWVWGFYSNSLGTTMMGISKFNSSGGLLFQRGIVNSSNRMRPGSVFVVGSTVYITATYQQSQYAPVIFKIPADGSKTGTYGGFTYADYGVSHNSDMSIIEVTNSTDVNFSSYSGELFTSPNTNTTITVTRNSFTVVP